MLAPNEEHRYTHFSFLLARTLDPFASTESIALSKMSEREKELILRYKVQALNHATAVRGLIPQMVKRSIPYYKKPREPECTCASRSDAHMRPFARHSEPRGGQNHICVWFTTGECVAVVRVCYFWHLASSHLEKHHRKPSKNTIENLCFCHLHRAQH